MLLLTFTAAGESYAVDGSGVVELVPRVGLRAVPHAPAELAGLLEYRGGVVPVIDLGVLLGSSPCADRLSTRIILVKGPPGGQNRGGGAAAPGPDRRAGHRPGRGRTRADRPGAGAPRPAPYLGAIARTDRGFVPLIEVAGLSLVLEPSSGPVEDPLSGALRAPSRGLPTHDE